MTFGRNRVYVTCADENNDRAVQFVDPSDGLWVEYFRCPEDTGSHLSFAGSNLLLSQWYSKQMFGIDFSGKLTALFNAPRGICGHVHRSGETFMITTDDEETDEYFLTVASETSGAYECKDVARVSFAARGLAFDGESFWTSHRDKGELVRFSM